VKIGEINAAPVPVKPNPCALDYADYALQVGIRHARAARQAQAALEQVRRHRAAEIGTI
jgi:hypothetical protein